MREGLRVAQVVYLMAPWIYGGQRAKLTHTWVRQMPGVNAAVTLTRYERANKGQLALVAQKRGSTHE